MASPSLDGFFVLPTALLGLGLLAPVILLYLLKPKPKKVRFPSTMFIKFIEKNKRFSSFLQKFIRDPILFLQLLIIGFLVIGLADPFTSVLEQQNEEQSVAIVIDASASMQSTDLSPTRIGYALSSVRKVLDGLAEKDDVSIVVAESIPVTLLTKGSVAAAKTIIGKIKPSDTATNIGDAVMLAKDMLSGGKKKKTIYVLSDFMNSQGLDPLIGRKVASVDGASVSFIKTCSEEASNVGVIALNARRSLVNESILVLTATLKNYANKDAAVNYKFVSEDKLLRNQTITIKASAEEFVYQEIGISDREQVGEVNILANDNLRVDDTAFVFIPSVKTYRVLLLTSDDPEKDKYLKLMLASLKNVELGIEVPPVAPSLKNPQGIDVIVLGTVSGNDILPGTFREIRSRVESGGTFIFLPSEDLPAYSDPDFWYMTPAYPRELMNEETNVEVTQEHEMLDNVVLDNVVLKKYLKVNETRDGAKVIVGTTGEHPSPLVAYSEIERGYAMFMNINPNPAWSNFYYSSSFPIMWSQMIRYFNRPKDSEALRNKITGDYLQLPEAHWIQTPEDKVESSTLFMDKTGVYSVYYDGRVDVFTANLLNSIESNLSCVDLKGSVQGEEFEVSKEETEVKREHYDKLLLIVLALIAIEALAYRRRGLM